jgi:CheY-like chemotaxis protein
VEDDAAVRKVAVATLETQGYRVLVAASGPEAVGLAGSHAGRIDLLLTDLIMPDMSGRETAEAVDGLRPGIKVLYMSGYTDDAVVRFGVGQDSSSFLQKPFTATSLGGKVREVLDRR